jgi:D-hydroxyproline dehydrogenase subunit alpha
VLATRVRILTGTTIVGEREPGVLMSDGEESCHLVAPRVIVATGGRELFLPFPGWTLPGVSGVGGLQALVKSGVDVRGKRVVVAGSGPLLLAVAHTLADRGASVQAVVEQADSATVFRFARGLWRHPGKLWQAMRLRASTLAVPYWTGAWPVRAEAVSGREPRLGAVTLFDGRQELRVECDLLACGFGLVPNLHLAWNLGARIERGSGGCAVVVDDLMKSGRVWAAGEPLGIGGVETALVEGQIAGLAAAGREDEARRLIPARTRSRAFAARLAEAFTLRPEVKVLAKLETIVCRCEDVPWGRIKACGSWREAKLQTRCGMGSCQGRVCGSAVEALTGWAVGDVRAPVSPVATRALADLLATPGSASTMAP